MRALQRGICDVWAGAVKLRRLCPKGESGMRVLRPGA